MLFWKTFLNPPIIKATIHIIFRYFKTLLFTLSFYSVVSCTLLCKNQISLQVNNQVFKHIVLTHPSWLCICSSIPGFYVLCPYNYWRFLETSLPKRDNVKLWIAIALNVHSDWEDSFAIMSIPLKDVYFPHAQGFLYVVCSKDGHSIFTMPHIRSGPQFCCSWLWAALVTC